MSGSLEHNSRQPLHEAREHKQVGFAHERTCVGSGAEQMNAFLEPDPGNRSLDLFSKGAIADHRQARLGAALEDTTEGLEEPEMVLLRCEASRVNEQGNAVSNVDQVSQTGCRGTPTAWEYSQGRCRLWNHRSSVRGQPVRALEVSAREVADRNDMVRVADQP